MHYEPKWDGYRCIVFRDGDEVVLGSRGGKQLERYFPEVVVAVAKELPAQCVLDGELILVRDQQLDFDLISQRIHPSARRIAELAAATPAHFFAFYAAAAADASYIDHAHSARPPPVAHIAVSHANPAMAAMYLPDTGAVVAAAAKLCQGDDHDLFRWSAAPL